ncbi:nad dependent epimerase dehydratase family [Pyrrhoderma noxium]|uniref:Nad dependent epimerase dehydratase family n=1 Tax=Pyrrhoderma noxium TaxID=2282107 RepID=A0A286UVA3_9AGAM|nr:nad dependent epimerase dehydratase family [Pyrrhoderma noxium]
MPAVIIFGGLNTYTRAFARHLIPKDGPPLVSHLRIVDKYSVEPPTTYLGADFPSVLKDPIVEYKQANLTIPAAVAKVFDPPEGKEVYDYVFDLTGEVRHDRSDMIQINQTVNIATLVGKEAAKRGVKAYVRVTQPFYETPEKGAHDEKESIKPSGMRGVWWHETLRALADIDGLNLVILRPGLVYGPYVEHGIIAISMTVASVYGYLKKPMKGLWSPGKNPMHTVHVEDVAAAAYVLADWMAKEGKAKANEIAGEEIPSNDKGKTKAAVSEIGEGFVLTDRNKKLVAPIFNLVDNSNSTLISVGTEITALFGTTFGFHDFFTTTMAKMTKLSESIIEDINEEHVGAWTEMITTSNPPIPNTPLSAYMDDSVLSKVCVAFSAEKIKRVTGFEVKHPKFTKEELSDVVDRWKEEGSWPNVEPKPE